MAARLPAGATPTAVLDCGPQTERVSGDGEWSFAVQRRATSGLPALVAALRLPSLPPTDGFCTASQLFPVEVLLEVGGKPLRVGTPKDACGQTRPEVLRAYSLLSFVTVTSTRVGQVRPESAVRAGCQGRKDELAMRSPTAGTAPAGPLLAIGPPVRVCRYRTNYPPGWSDDGHHQADGDPQSGRQLTAASSAEVVHRLALAGPVAACHQQHTRFAVVDQPTSGTVYVELDGCLRVMSLDPYTLHQGDARLVTLLTAG